MNIHRIAAFTRDGQGGNPAGVALYDILPPETEMQRIAHEIAYSETAFAAPEGDAWRVRYFSPETEVAFCGHATIALGAVLAQVHGPGTYRLDIPAGRILVRGSKRDGRGYSVLESPPTRHEPVADAVIEAALALFGYSRDDLDPALPTLRAHAGADHLILPLRTHELLRAMRYDLDAGRQFMRRHGFVTVALVWREAERVFHVRNAFASGGVLEDPATGAAAAALGGLLRDRGLLAAGELLVLQGDDMGRPSRLDVQFTDVPGSAVSVAGETAPIPADAPVAKAPAETFEDLLRVPGLRIERIVSHGRGSPPGFWYEQDWDEWVMVLEGSASLRIEGRDGPVRLGPGEHCWLPAGCRHRVESTSGEPPTVWLAVHKGDAIFAEPPMA